MKPETEKLAADAWEENVEIILSDRHGQFIPQIFAEEYLPEDYPDRETLLDPENEHYWDTFIMVEQNWTDDQGRNIYLNGDLYLIDYKALNARIAEIAEKTGDIEDDISDYLFNF